MSVEGLDRAEARPREEWGKAHITLAPVPRHSREKLKTRLRANVKLALKQEFLLGLEVQCRDLCTGPGFSDRPRKPRKEFQQTCFQSAAAREKEWGLITGLMGSHLKFLVAPHVGDVESFQGVHSRQNLRVHPLRGDKRRGRNHHDDDKKEEEGEYECGVIFLQRLQGKFKNDRSCKRKV